MSNPFDFPPGSLGAQQAGCMCDSPEARDVHCPMHGVVAMLDAEVQRAQVEAWEYRIALAATRMRRLMPFTALVTLVLVVGLAYVGEVVARAFVIGMLSVTFTAWWAWNRP